MNQDAPEMCKIASVLGGRGRVVPLRFRRFDIVNIARHWRSERLGKSLPQGGNPHSRASGLRRSFGKASHNQVMTDALSLVGTKKDAMHALPA